MTLISGVGEHIGNYVALRKTLGYKFETQARTLANFDRFLAASSHAGPVTQDVALAFVSARGTGGHGWRSRQYQFVRDFADYLSAFVPNSPPMDRRPIKAAMRPVPYVMTDGEVRRLLEQAREHRSRGHGSFCGLTYFAMFGLAASTGMRAGEVARLRREDVRLDQATIRIVNTKFGKSRLIALHRTTIDALRDYSLARATTMAHADCEAFFISLKLRQFGPASLSLAFSRVRSLATIDERATFHSLRHTFAVNCLLRWYREGKDVNALLPALATYMGHVNYTSTAYYLTATAELLEMASKRLTAYEASR